MSIDESEFTEMKDKLMEQETIIEDLQSEMENLRIISVQHKEQTQKVYIYSRASVAPTLMGHLPWLFVK